MNSKFLLLNNILGFIYYKFNKLKKYSSINNILYKIFKIIIFVKKTNGSV